VETLPNDIVKLSSLKVLSLRDNKMTELPLCLADMVSLQRLKLDGNDTLVFPPREAIEDGSSPPRDRSARDADATTETEKALTTRIKKYLKQYALEQAEAADDGSEGAETPRIPTKRNVSGRFPIKVNGSNLPSPAVAGRPPLTTSRAHYRGLSQQGASAASRRPGFLPLTMGSVGERGRSNSETLLQASRADGRSRRMASAKASQLGTLDELQPNNRLSHYRGLSHGSAMQGAANGSSKSPNTPVDPYLQRPTYVRRLSVLPERRHDSKVFDPVVEAAKGILYSVFQIHPVIQILMSLTHDDAHRRSSLEIVFYNTNSHVEVLEQEIQKHDPANYDDEDGGGGGEGDDGESDGGSRPASRDPEAVLQACRTLVKAYNHVCTLLVDNIDAFVERGDPRYVRTLLTQLWSSIMELRVTLGSMAADAIESEAASTPPQSQSSSVSLSRPPSHTSSVGSVLMMNSTIRVQSRESSVTPTVERLRPRPAPYPHPQSASSSLRVATDVAGGQQTPSGLVSAVSATSATPRSGESFASTSSQALSAVADFAEEDRQFERVFLSLKKSSDIVLRTLPGFNSQMLALARQELAKKTPDRVAAQLLDDVAKACSHSISRTDALKRQMSDVKFKDPTVRGGQSAFWTASRAFLHAWIEAGSTMKRAARHQSHMPMPQDARLRLRPVQRAVKETMEVILDSPWHWLARQAMHGGEHDGSPSGVPSSASDAPPHAYHPHGGHSHAGSAVSVHTGVLSPQQMPMTPQSAALGPAMQATVPSTPSSAAAAFVPFHPAAFERSDTFSSFGWPSASRSGTMTSATTSGTHSTLNSLSSFSSMSDGGSGGFLMSPSSSSSAAAAMATPLSAATTTSMGVLMAPALPPLGRAQTSRGVF
jgi:hypothetical protein